MWALSLHALCSYTTFGFLPHRVNTSLLKKPMCYTFKYASQSLSAGNPIASVKRNTIPVGWCSFRSEGLNSNHIIRVDELATFPIKRSFYIARYSFYNIMSKKIYQHWFNLKTISNVWYTNFPQHFSLSDSGMVLKVIAIHVNIFFKFKVFRLFEKRDEVVLF